jgi:hypothetical protein
MFNFSYWLDHGLEDWALIHARVWHETGHLEAARILGLEVAPPKSLREPQPRLKHRNRNIQAQADALPFVIDAMAVSIDICAYGAGDEEPGPPMAIDLDDMLEDHIAHRFETGTGCLRGCDRYPRLLDDPDWLEQAVDLLLPAVGSHRIPREPALELEPEPDLVPRLPRTRDVPHLHQPPRHGTTPGRRTPGHPRSLTPPGTWVCGTGQKFLETSFPKTQAVAEIPAHPPGMKKPRIRSEADLTLVILKPTSTTGQPSPDDWHTDGHDDENE